MHNQGVITWLFICDVIKRSHSVPIVISQLFQCEICSFLTQFKNHLKLGANSNPSFTMDVLGNKTICHNICSILSFIN